MIDLTNKKTPAFVILRREYLQITENFCAAKLIEYFKYWTSWKLKEHRTPWIYQPLKNIYDALMGEHSMHVIRGAIVLLEDLGIIERQKNPGNGQDKTWQYKLRLDILNQRLERRKRETEDPECKNEHAEFTVESHHRSNPKDPDPLSPDPLIKGEERENELTAVEENLSDLTPDWDKVAEQASLWEQEQISKLNVDFNQASEPVQQEQLSKLNVDLDYAVEPKQVHQTNESITGLSDLSAAPETPTSKIPKPRTTKQLEELEVWEIAPGVPFSVFLNWRADKKYKKKGGDWANDAYGIAYSEFYNNRKRTTNALVPEFLEYLKTVSVNCNEQLSADMKALLPSCFALRPEATKENVRQLMQNIYQLVEKGAEVALPQGIATPSGNQSMSFAEAQSGTIAPLKELSTNEHSPQIQAIVRYLESGNEPAAKAIALRHNIDINQLVNHSGDTGLVYNPH